MKAICNLNVIPVRRDPSDKSEQVTQLLFGETAEITARDGNWRKIRITYDDYQGWADFRQLVEISDKQFEEITNHKSFVSTDLLQLAIWNNNQICPLVIGSSLPLYSDHKFYLAQTEYIFEGNIVDASTPRPENLVEQAYMFLNAPYQWGGRSPFGIDCSGLTQIIFKICGLKLMRDAAQQAEQGELINFIEESHPGDLAFFSNEEGKIVHVGMIIPGRHIVHASGRVRIDTLDHEGIFNQELNKYTHKLRLIRRIS